MKKKHGKIEAFEVSSQDLYKMYTEHGMKKEKILSLGFIGLGVDSKMEDLTVNVRNQVLMVCINLKVVISEALKSSEFRDDRKMLGFLQMVIDASDKLHAIDADFFMMHTPSSTEKEISLD